MHYWNQDNFEGLKSIGEFYINKTNFQLYGQYCIQREQGLRKKSIDTLNLFISDLRKSSTSKQKLIAEEISYLIFKNPDVHQLLTHPIQKEFENIFERWKSTDSDSATPYRWLGFFTKDSQYLLSALRIDCNDQISTSLLLQSNLRDIFFDLHHLNESMYLGNPEETLKIVRESLLLIGHLDDNKIKEKFFSQVKHSQIIIENWMQFSGENTTLSFPDWCTNKGCDFNLGKTYYY